MKEEIVSFETAKLAKEKGFDWKVRDSYIQYLEAKIALDSTSSLYDCNHNMNVKQYSAPTQSLLQRWLREEHGIHVWVQPNLLWQRYHHKGIVDRKETHNTNIAFDGESMKDTYEEALEAGLQEALKLIK